MPFRLFPKEIIISIFGYIPGHVEMLSIFMKPFQPNHLIIHLNYMKKLYFTVGIVAISLTMNFGQDVRLWATYHGDTGNESGVSVATDPWGNVYLAGITSSISNLGIGGHQTFFGGGNVDAYVVKFNPAGNLVWSTWYGGPGDEMTFLGGKLGIATDLQGNVFLAGLTNSATNIASIGSYQDVIGGSLDAYLVKFDSSGVRQWATYYGGTDIEYGYNVGTDPLGNVYLTGITGSAAGIASGGFQNTLNGPGDAFLVKFNAAGNRLWGTYYGGPNGDEGFAIATDDSAHVYLAGVTGSTSGIASGGFQNTYGGGSYDAFLIKFDSSGARIWGTYYGGTGDEMAIFNGDIDVAIDDLGNPYLTGMTTSTSSIASGGFQNSYGGGGSDAFLVKFTPGGARSWSTYYGGNGDDKGYSIAADASENIFMAGRTTSTSGISSGGFQNVYGTNEDGFVVKFNSAGSRYCATYYGGNDYDVLYGLDVDNSGNIYTGGGTATTTGMASGGAQNSFGGGQSDAYLVKLGSCIGSVGVEDPNLNDLFIYPNPSNGKYFIETNGEPIEDIQVYDVQGKIIYTSKYQKQIDISSSPKGIYFFKINIGEKTYVKKIIVD